MGFLGEIINLLTNPQNARLGDAVYSQEAFDRILSALAEANPQSNGAPPATQTAIDRLEKKAIDDEMLGPEGKAECTICIDDLSKGDEVLVLPCKHWFHNDCVIYWLRQHNTCPICRTPIEARGAAGRTNSSSNGPQSATSGHAPFSSSTSEPGRMPSSSSQFAQAQNPPPIQFMDWTAHFAQPAPQARQERAARDPSESLDRLQRIRRLAELGNNSALSEANREYMQSGGSAGEQRRSSQSPAPGPYSALFEEPPRRDRNWAAQNLGGPSWATATTTTTTTTGAEAPQRQYSGSNAWFTSGRDLGRDQQQQPLQRSSTTSGGANPRDNHQNREGQNNTNSGSGGGSSSSSGSHGPLSWLREHLGRGSGSGQDRDRRR